jgi:hypothetical protein
LTGLAAAQQYLSVHCTNNEHRPGMRALREILKGAEFGSQSEKY